MPILDRLRQTVNRNRFFRRLYDVSKICIHISIFYIVREGLSEEDGIDVKAKLDPCDIVFLKSSDMKAIAEFPDEQTTEKTLLKRLSEGGLCIGILYGNEIAAYMWCNLREFRYASLRFALMEDEAYLLDARTLSSYRGRNLAPYLRVQLYKHLRQIGKTKLMSITEYANTPAKRFKEKLNAKPEKLYLGIKLFMRYKWVILLKTYKN